MGSTRETIGCTLCGWGHAPARFGIDAKTGKYDPHARPPKTVLYRHHYGPPKGVQVEKASMPMHLAQGLRSALRASLALVEQEILEAGGTLDDE